MAKAKESVPEEAVPQEAPVPDIADSATPAVPETPAVETPAAPSFLDMLKEEGFADIETPEQAQERLLAAYRQSKKDAEENARRLSEQQVYAKYGQEYLEGLRSNPQPSAPPSQSERKDWWTPPKYEQAVAERYREAKPDGSYGWKENTPAEIRASAEAYQSYVENWAHQLATNPKEALRGIKEEIREELLSEFDNKYKGYRQQETEQEFWDRTNKENDWMFAKDPRTNQPVYGQLSEDGTRLAAHYQRAVKLGIASPQDQWEYAKSMYDAEHSHTQVAQVTQQQTNQQAAANQRKAVSQRGRSLGPNRNGSQPPQTNPNASVQNPRLTAGEMLREEMRAAGTSLT